MKNRKIFTILCAIFLFICLCPASFAADRNLVMVKVDREAVATNGNAPVVDSNSRILLPLRSIANSMNVTVNWDKANNTISFEDTDRQIKVIFSFGSKQYQVVTNDNSSIKSMDTTITVKNGVSYAPVRYLAEALGYTTEYNSFTQTVNLFSSAPALPEITDVMTFYVKENTIQELQKFYREAFINNAACLQFYCSKDMYDTFRENNYNAYNKSMYVYTADVMYLPSEGPRPVYRTEDGDYYVSSIYFDMDFAVPRKAATTRDAEDFLDYLYASGLLNTGMSQKAKAKVIADEVYSRCKYECVNDDDYTAWSVFRLHKACCQGYTAAYNTLLGMENIECYGLGCFVGTHAKHSITYAKLDGSFCYIDATWHNFDFPIEMYKEEYTIPDNQF